MWQRFTERARKVVFYAQEEAGRLGHKYVSTEHLLLGLVRENDSVAARILDRMSVSLGRIRSEVERQVTRGDGKPGQDMQLSPYAKRVIDLAYDEARQLNNNYIGTEHMLLGLIREGEGLAGQVLAKLHVELERTQREVRSLQAGPDNPHRSADQNATGIKPRSQRVLESAHKVLFYAQEEVGRLGGNVVSSEHLLLGLLREKGSVAARVLTGLGISLETIRSEIERQVSRDNWQLTLDMRLSSSAKRVLDLAYGESSQLKNDFIGTEHLLLGAISDGEGLAGRALSDLGVDLDRTRDEVKVLQKELGDKSG